MQRTLSVLIVALVATIAVPVGADTGLFTSYSTTAMRAPGQLQLNVNVDTTGMVSTGSDYVWVLGFAFPAAGTGSAFSTTYLPRTAVGTGAFAGSFSITGLNDNVSYKWLTMSLGDLYGFGPSTFYYGFLIPYYYLYEGCLPISPGTTSFWGGLFATSPDGTGTLPIFCTATPTGGPLYDFLNSNVNAINATINWWYTDGTSADPIWANGVAGGTVAALATIPTLAGWGLILFGGLIAGSGAILLRHS
jgi:hypothetical protein